MTDTEHTLPDGSSSIPPGALLRTPPAVDLWRYTIIDSRKRESVSKETQDQTTVIPYTRVQVRVWKVWRFDGKRFNAVDGSQTEHVDDCKLINFQSTKLLGNFFGMRESTMMSFVTCVARKTIRRYPLIILAADFPTHKDHPIWVMQSSKPMFRIAGHGEQVHIDKEFVGVLHVSIKPSKESGIAKVDERVVW